MAQLITVLNKLSIMQRIGIIGILPLLVIFQLSYGILSDAQVRMHAADGMDQALKVKTPLGNLVHELQKERSLSAAYLASGGGAYHREDLLDQRIITDKAVAIFSNTQKQINAAQFGAEYERTIKKATAELNELDTVRGSIADLTLSFKDSKAYYTQTVADLYHLLEEMVSQSDDAAIVRMVKAYIDFTLVKELSSQERSVVMAAMAAGVFDPTEYAKFIDLMGKQDAYLADFYKVSSVSEQRFYEKTVLGDTYDQVQMMRNELLQNNGALEGLSFTESQWYEIQTEKNNSMKLVEDYVIQDIANFSKQITEAASSEFYSLLIELVLIVGAVVFLVVANVISIRQPMNHLIDVMKRLIDGEKDVTIRFQSLSSELGEIARCLNRFQQATEEQAALERKAFEAEKMRMEQEEAASAKERERKESEIALKEQEMKHAADISRRRDELIAQFNDKIRRFLDGLSGNASGLFDSVDRLGNSITVNSNGTAQASASSNGASENVAAGGGCYGRIVAVNRRNCTPNRAKQNGE